MSIEELMAKYQSGGPKSRGKTAAIVRPPIDSDDSSSEESDDDSELSDNMSEDDNDDTETDNLKESFGLKSLVEEDSNKTKSQVNEVIFAIHI